MTVGQVVAKITPDVDKSEDAGQGQEAADTGAPSDQAEALEKESTVSAGDHLNYLPAITSRLPGFS